MLLQRGSEGGRAGATATTALKPLPLLVLALVAVSVAGPVAARRGERRHAGDPEVLDVGLAAQQEGFEVTMEGTLRVLVGDFFNPNAGPADTLYFLRTPKGASVRLLLPRLVAEDPDLQSGDRVRVLGDLVDAPDQQDGLVLAVQTLEVLVPSAP
mmetsp:Transcript_12262/g.35997  ORF Transcript_12262/g.35997 Transcript_12262/m.35997 type:complete len:155 (+) Transcript_12262:341-805(+)